MPRGVPGSPAAAESGSLFPCRGPQGNESVLPSKRAPGGDRCSELTQTRDVREKHFVFSNNSNVNKTPAVTTDPPLEGELVRAAVCGPRPPSGPRRRTRTGTEVCAVLQTAVAIPGPTVQFREAGPTPCPLPRPRCQRPSACPPHDHSVPGDESWVNACTPTRGRTSLPTASLSLHRTGKGRCPRWPVCSAPRGLRTGLTPQGTSQGGWDVALS